VASVNEMVLMFYGYGASAFNQPLNDWNMVSVADMGSMFYQATNFNQPLKDWNLASVNDMTSIFNTATNFNHPLDDWDNVASVSNMHGMYHDGRRPDHLPTRHKTKQK